ncbi:peptidase family M1-domain-containing protein [Tuber brumale]|nr:peptidase family M1-domain-containing protein [Tuber brumale]
MCYGKDSSGSVDITQEREVLPGNVKPIHYAVELEPSFETFKYDGTVTIDLEIVEKSTAVAVNLIDIDIKEVSLEHNGSSHSPTDSSHNEETQTINWTFEETIPAGAQASLTIKFQGLLNDNMAGFYRSSYKDEEGNIKYMATTQMEPTDARRALPCFDQPDLKATWDVTLICDKNLTALSNMDVKEEKELDNGKKSVSFNRSPKMSTYLLAFIVGDLRFVENNDFRVPIRVYATPGSEHHGHFSAELAAKTLEFYDKTFDYPYPLPKMDMVAIPDFSAGAMENWGLVTYRVVDLLYDEKTAALDRKQRIAEVVQHELAHQWFGNLVTMDFWEGLWLNEGFATWMSWYSGNKFYPQWKVWESYVTDSYAGALGLDGLRSSHPIEVPVKKVSEINQIFDSISYLKGSSILRMISVYLGEDVFLEGIRRYLKKHAYGNTQTGDLWAALSDASGKDVESDMATWTKKIGYPVITVEEHGSKLHLTQNRYLRTADVKPEEDETLWPIFLGLRTKSGIADNLTFKARNTTIELDDPEFYKLNANHTGVYRTLYSPERLAKLVQAADLLSVEDRAGLLGDAGALATSGYQKTSGLLDLLVGLKNEKEYIVWSEVASRIGNIKAAWLFEPKEVFKGFKGLQKGLFAPIAHEIGWDFKPEDSDILQQLKALTFSQAGYGGDEKVVAAAKEMFKKFAGGDVDAINPNIRTPVYHIVLQHGDNDGEKEWDIIHNVYLNGRTSDERNGALRALGRSENAENIQKTLDICLNGEVKEQDIYQPISGLRAHAAGTEALWAWTQKNWDTLVKKLPPGLSMLGGVVSTCTGGFTSEEAIADIEKFFEDKSQKGFDRSLAQSLDGIRAKAAWVKRDADDVKAWLKAKGYTSAEKL